MGVSFWTLEDSCLIGNHTTSSVLYTLSQHISGKPKLSAGNLLSFRNDIKIESLVETNRGSVLLKICN